MSAAKPEFVHKTRTQLVAEVVREKILRGEIKGGEPLRQDALAKEFSVSRIPVREALLLLEAQGLVKFEAHKGAVVTELSAERIQELFELRALVETHVLSQALDNMQPSDLAAAQNVLEEFDHALDTGTQVEDWSALNYRFHYALYAPSRLPLAMEMIENLNTKSDRYIRMQLLFTQGIQKAEKEHHQLLELCRNGNKEAALALLRSHILEAAESIATLLKENG